MSTRVSSRTSWPSDTGWRSVHSVAFISARSWRTLFAPATPHSERSTPSSRSSRANSSTLLGRSSPLMEAVAPPGAGAKLEEREKTPLPGTTKAAGSGAGAAIGAGAAVVPVEAAGVVGFGLLKASAM